MRDTDADQGECREQAARRGIGGELAEKGLGIDDLVEEGSEFVPAEEEKPLAGEKRQGVRADDALEMPGPA